MPSGPLAGCIPCVTGLFSGLSYRWSKCNSVNVNLDKKTHNKGMKEQCERYFGMLLDLSLYIFLEYNITSYILK